MKLTKNSLNALIGLWRSRLIYYGIPGRKRRLKRFYKKFLSPGNLGFDIGAHLGNRANAWEALGARVVAVEPQPYLCQNMKRRFRDKEAITIVQKAIGAESGKQKMFISNLHPTVSSMAVDWMEEVRQMTSFQGVQWDDEVEVEVITLDRLIENYGVPDFCKIDVEGYEYEVLQGLNYPVPALSFEYLPATIADAQACIRLLEKIGNYQYNLSILEKHSFFFGEWLDHSTMIKALEKFREDKRPGDIYARLK